MKTLTWTKIASNPIEAHYKSVNGPGVDVSIAT